MQSFRHKLILSLLIIGIGVGSFFYLNNFDSQKAKLPAPDKTAALTIKYLPANENDGELLVEQHFDTNGIMREKHIKLRAGDEKIVYYNEAGNPSRMRFPQDVQAEIICDSLGRVLQIKETKSLPDPDSPYTLFIFNPQKKQLRLAQTFLQKVLWEELRFEESGAKEVRHFTQDGKTVSHLHRLENDGSYKDSHFHDDGKTLKQVFSFFKTGAAEFKTYNQDGVLECVASRKKLLDLFSTYGAPPRGDGEDETGSLSVYREDGVTLWFSVSNINLTNYYGSLIGGPVVIKEFYPDGKTLYRLISPNEDLVNKPWGNWAQVYNKDGKLIERQYLNGDQIRLSETIAEDGSVSQSTEHDSFELTDETMSRVIKTFVDKDILQHLSFSPFSQNSAHYVELDYLKQVLAELAK